MAALDVAVFAELSAALPYGKMQELVGLFVCETDFYMTEIAARRAEGDLDSVARLARNIVSIAGNLGAARASCAGAGAGTRLPQPGQGGQLPVDQRNEPGLPGRWRGMRVWLAQDTGLASHRLGRLSQAWPLAPCSAASTTRTRSERLEASILPRCGRGGFQPCAARCPAHRPPPCWSGPAPTCPERRVRAASAMPEDFSPPWLRPYGCAPWSLFPARGAHWPAFSRRQRAFPGNRWRRLSSRARQGARRHGRS